MRPTTALRTTCAEGVIFLQQGNPQAARQSFQKSTKGLASVIAECDDYHGRGGCRTKHDPSSSGYTIISPSTSFLGIQRCRPEYVHSPDDSFAFYNKCFVILDSDNLDEAQQSTIATAMVYNIGFTFHMEFLCSGSMSSLNVAASFYRKALSVFNSSRGNLIPPSTMDCVLLMAIFHNLGHCNAHVFNATAVNLCRKEVRNLVEGYWGEGLQNTTVQEDFEFFYVNLGYRGDDNVILIHSPAA